MITPDISTDLALAEAYGHQAYGEGAIMVPAHCPHLAPLLRAHNAPLGGQRPSRISQLVAAWLRGFALAREEDMARGSTTDAAMTTFRNAACTGRCAEATTVAACVAVAAPEDGMTWIADPQAITAGMIQLYRQGGVRYFGWM